MNTTLQSSTSSTDNDKAIVAFNAALTHEKSDVVILADVSASMHQFISGRLSGSRFDAMKNCLLRVVGSLDQAAVILFGERHCKLRSWEHFYAAKVHCGHSTNLADALRAANKLNPSHIIIITDGEPNSENDALNQARTMLCKIDVYYCGPGESRAVRFCNEVAQYGGQAVIDPECVTMIGAVQLFLCDTISA